MRDFLRQDCIARLPRGNLSLQGLLQARQTHVWPLDCHERNLLHRALSETSTASTKDVHSACAPGASAQRVPIKVNLSTALSALTASSTLAPSCLMVDDPSLRGLRVLLHLRSHVCEGLTSSSTVDLFGRSRNPTDARDHTSVEKMPASTDHTVSCSSWWSANQSDMVRSGSTTREQ